MNLLLLPGNSPDHKIWIREIEKLLLPNFVKTAVIEYDNWLPESPSPIADLNIESTKIRQVVVGWGDYCIFAKSIGVALALKNIKEGIISPQKCVFVGTPVLWARQNGIDLDRWIVGLDIPSLFVQQKSDPCMPSIELKQFLIDRQVSNYTYIEVGGNDHNYGSSDTVKIAREFFF